MLSMICILETCVVLIFCLKSIYKGFNASGLCLSILSSLYLSSLNIGAEGVGVIVECLCLV